MWCGGFVGNKDDMESERKATKIKEQGENFAAQYGMKFFETSEKENTTNVSDDFIAMTKEIIKTADNKKSSVKKDNNVKA